jgi:hypothetical protein
MKKIVWSVASFCPIGLPGVLTPVRRHEAAAMGPQPDGSPYNPLQKVETNAMTTRVRNKTSRQVQLQKVLSGLAKHYTNVTLTLGGASYPEVDLAKLVQQDLDAMTASATAAAALATVVQSERDAHAKVDPVLRLLKSYVISQFGDTQVASSVLADFGYSPRKSTKPTVATKAEALVKTEATRKERHTLGPKQKAQITGTPPVVPAPKLGA